MAESYAARLKKGVSYGACGLPETFDTSRVFREKASKLVEFIRNSKQFVVHTGAGISTSSGIPDFRGPNGVWTKEKKGIKPDASNDFSFEDARPSLTHMALLGLIQAGILKHICSQNVDGLHFRSGVPEDKLSELHGNVFQEKCEKCKKFYLRDFDLKGIGFKYTGRRCEEDGCDGLLRDTLLDWDDPLPEDALEISRNYSETADLVLCLGTSLRVQPANQIPLLALKHGGKVVICNLQKTPVDSRVTLKIHAYCDELMKEVMQQLDIKIPVYKLYETFYVGTKHNGTSWVFYITSEQRLKCAQIERVDIIGANLKVTLEEQPFEFVWNPSDDEIQDEISWNVVVHFRKKADRKTYEFVYRFEPGQIEKNKEDKHVVDIVTIDYNTVCKKAKSERDNEESDIRIPFTKRRKRQSSNK